ncbi:unnamed protein product [Auanema sp. JU1783]|nr:unnamed protein product [Auanema sp. JU1783]
MEAEKGDVPSIDRKEEENLSPFELLPREIKEKILERVIDETACLDEFKKFWRLKRVNKEFNSIFSSSYAERHFVKYPCWIAIHDDKQTSHKSGRAVAFVKISYPITRKDISYTKMTEYDDILNNGVKFVYSRHKILWDSISTFFRAKPFRIDLVFVDPLYATDQLISTIAELANQSSEETTVLIFPSCRDDGLDFDVHDEEELTDAFRKSYIKIVEGLLDVHAAGKIKLRFDKHFFDSELPDEWFL